MSNFFHNLGIGIVSTFVAFTGLFHQAPIETLQPTPPTQAIVSSSSESIPAVSTFVSKKTQTINNSIETKKPVAQEIQPTGTLCNGTYWNECLVGQNFVCPATGNAYCQTPQQPVQPVQQKNNYQICKNSYGHATWDGTSYNNNGGPTCSCDVGYTFNGKTCEVLGTPYKAGDGNWYYPNAYDVNGRNLQAPAPVQQQSVVVSTSDSGACLDAKQKFSDFEKQVPYLLNNAGNGVASEIAQGRIESERQTLSVQENTLQQAVNNACQ